MTEQERTSQETDGERRLREYNEWMIQHFRKLLTIPYSEFDRWLLGLPTKED